MSFRKNTVLHLAQFLFVVLMIGSTGIVRAQTQPNITPLYFTGVVGGDEPWGRRVLVRWFTLEQFIPLETSLIYRTDKDGVREHIATVKRSRSASVIKNVFYRPGEQRILDDAKVTLERIYGTSGANEDDFVGLIVDLLEGKDAEEYASARRNFLMQTNYGFAIIEGFGYLDYVDPALAPFDYELWQGDASGSPIAPLGRITIDASVPDLLPPPAALKEIFLLGRDGSTPARSNHRRIFLDWDLSPELYERRDINFGFNIYKLDRALEGGEDFYSVRHLLQKVNRVPVMPPSPIPDEDESQSYLFADDGEWLQTLDEDDLLPVGATYTYWAVARDLLGNEGEPSNPLESTVRDTFEPDFPRNVQVFPAKDAGDNPLLRVIFDKQTEDTSFYRIYRYQSYQNQGYKGPFADINGLTEGLIAEIPVPANPAQERVEYDDLEPGTTDLGRVFWYCISAVDAHDNESALSPPTRGVIDDVSPPVLDGVLSFCLSRPLLDMIGTVEVKPEGREENWRPLFKIVKRHPVFTLVRIYRDRPLEGEQGRPEVIAELSLTTSTTRYFEEEPDDTVTDGPLIPTYKFEAETFDGQVVSVEVDPPRWVPGDPRPCYTVNLDVSGYDENCFTGPSTRQPLDIPIVPGGDIPPVRFQIDCVGDTGSARLYRSIDGGKTYTFVNEFICDEGVNLELVDDFHPDSLAEVKYSISAVDENGNIGPPYYVPARYIYVNDVPRPTLTEVVAVGTNIPTQRDIQIQWSGPTQGISHYEVIITEKGDPNFITTPTPPIELPMADVNDAGALGDFAYDDQTGLFSARLHEINRDNDTLEANEEYTVRLAVVAKAGVSASSTNVMPFIWAADKLGYEGGPGVLRWAARPLPPVEEYEHVISVKHEASISGVLIPVRNENPEFPAIDFIEPPFQVWKRRADVTNEPWSSVSPVIEEIRRNGGVVDDPFFYKDFHTVNFVDDSGHVPFRDYEYIILDLNKNTYEIDRVIGPFIYQIELTPQ